MYTTQTLQNMTETSIEEKRQQDEARARARTKSKNKVEPDEGEEGRQMIKRGRGGETRRGWK